VESSMKNLEATVKQKMAIMEGTANSYSHVDRVLRIARFLAEKEKADAKLVQTAALLHDLGWTVGQPHNETGAKLANEILSNVDCPQKEREKIVKIVLLHPLDFRDKLCTLEEKIVWDADKIDLLGVIGIARAFHWGGNKPFETVLKYCFEVGIPIYSKLNTATAKEIAGERHRKTVTFLSALEQELSLRDLKIH
jgi:uncharacterized protein